MLDHVSDYASLNPLLVYVLCPHGGLQFLHVCRCYVFSHQSGKKALNVLDCEYLSQDMKDNFQSDVSHHGNTSFSLSHSHCLPMPQVQGTGLLRRYSLKMTLHYYSLSQSASHPLLRWEAPQWHIQRLTLTSPTVDCASGQSFLQSFRNRYRLGSSEASLIFH